MRYLMLFLLVLSSSFAANGREYSSEHYQFAKACEGGPIKDASWSRDSTLWLKVSPNVSKEQAEAAADVVAPKCHGAIGKRCCVHIYYGNMRELARVCE